MAHKKNTNKLRSLTGHLWINRLAHFTLISLLHVTFCTNTIFRFTDWLNSQLMDRERSRTLLSRAIPTNVYNLISSPFVPKWVYSVLMPFKHLIYKCMRYNDDFLPHSSCTFNKYTFLFIFKLCARWLSHAIYFYLFPFYMFWIRKIPLLRRVRIQ